VVKKAFFKKPTVAEVRNSDPQTIKTIGGLLNFASIAGKDDFAEAHFSFSRSEGRYIKLIGFDHRKLPQDTIKTAVENLNNKFNTFGYHWAPFESFDLRNRVVPFPFLTHAMELFIYMNQVSPANVETIYGSKNPYVKVELPSIEKGECRKNIFLEGLPVKKNSHAWNLKMSEESDRPTFLAYNSSILSGDMKRDAIIFSPYDIAAYWALATKEAEQGNTDLWVNNPFMVPSQKFLSRMVAISNNVVVKDSRNSKGFRHFRLEELCKLAKHVIMDLGYSGSAYSRANDGSIKEYNLNRES